MAESSCWYPYLGSVLEASWQHSKNGVKVLPFQASVKEELRIPACKGTQLDTADTPYIALLSPLDKLAIHCKTLPDALSTLGARLVTTDSVVPFGHRMPRRDTTETRQLLCTRLCTHRHVRFFYGRVGCFGASRISSDAKTRLAARYG